MVTGYEMKNGFLILDKMYWEFSMVLKWQKRETDHSPTSAENKNSRNITSTCLYLRDTGKHVVPIWILWHVLRLYVELLGECYSGSATDSWRYDHYINR
jgi:hypothetical protein